MSKFFLVAILGITLLLIIGVFILAGNRKVNLLAFVENALQVLLVRENSNKQQEIVYLPQNKEEAKNWKTIGEKTRFLDQKILKMIQFQDTWF